MADNKATRNYYQLRGENQKTSKYEFPIAEFLKLRNVDFDVPNALQKRPGQTQAISVGTSGPISSLFEFTKLTGESFVVAGSNTAQFYIASGGLTLLSAGWNNGQPTDMLTFVNKLWMANGQKFEYWDGASAPLAAVLPCPPQLTSFRAFGGNSNFLGVGFSSVVQAYFAYTYLRTDGTLGEMDFNSVPAQNPGDLFTPPGGVTLSSFTAPTGFGITALALYGYVGTSAVSTGNFEFASKIVPLDGTAFKRITLLPLGTTVTTILANDFNFFSLAANPATAGFTGYGFCYRNTYIPKYIEINQNYMFSSGFSIAPSAIRNSDLGEPEVYDPEAVFEARTDDGDRVMGLKAFNDQMVIFKEHSFHKVVGDSPDNFQLVLLSTDFGCLSNKSICTYKQKLVWLDRKGIMEYNGASFDIISTSIELIFRRMNVSAAKEMACAVHHLYRNQIWFGIPIDGSTVNNFTVIYDYLIGAWTFFDGYSPASFAYAQGALTKQTAWRGDYSGMIHFFGESFLSDSGLGISCVVGTRFDNVGGENQTTLWRRLFLDIAQGPGLTGTIQGKVFTNYDLTTVQATFSMYQSQLQFQNRIEMGVQGKAIAAEFSHYSASLPFLMNGYGWANRGLRNV